MKPAQRRLGVVVALTLAVGAGLWWWLGRGSAPPGVPAQPVVQAPAAASTASPPPTAPSSVAAAASAVVMHPVPVEPAAAASAAPPSLESMLTDLFGRKSVLTMFQLQDFAHRFVATVDNLGRSQASSRLWPLDPAPGRFLVAPRAAGSVIGADNGLRYTAHVLLLEAVEPRQLAAFYVRLYPQFQQAYEQLGYPRRYFNDRLIEVIDLLLATPEPDGPIGVHLPTANSPVPPVRPWVLYEFDDEALQSLSAGQKMLLRMGPVNERRVKTRLKLLRELLATGHAAR